MSKNIQIKLLNFILLILLLPLIITTFYAVPSNDDLFQAAALYDNNFF